MLIRMEKIDSSNIDSFEYDTIKKELVIQFKGGRKYKYFDVPRDIVNGFKKAKSFGGWFNFCIKDCYKYERMD